jgi:hypothetical protein
MSLPLWDHGQRRLPGYVVTPQNKDFFANREVYDNMANKTAVGRLGFVEEISGPFSPWRPIASIT